MKSEQRHEISIPEDVVALILSHLSLNSLSRFKAISRSWALSIQSLRLPPFFIGFFYQKRFLKCASYEVDSTRFTYPIFRPIATNDDYLAVDPFLSFLPSDRITDDYMRIRVLDCCNGILLCRSNCYKNFVCNPLTRSWTVVEVGTDFERQFSLLDFDPKVFPFFKVVSFCRSEKHPHSKLCIWVFSSETPGMKWKLYEPVSFRNPSDRYYRLMCQEDHHAFWEGSLFSLISSGGVSFGDKGKIMRFDLLKDGDDVDCHLTKLPEGTEKPRSVSLGRLRDKLCLAGLDRINRKERRLRVWSLSKRDQSVWVMEHESIIPSNLKSPNIGGFHPFLDVIFILSAGIAYAYDLKNLSLNEVCGIRVGRQLAIDALLFPFFPSSMDYSVAQKTKRRSRS